MKRIFIFLIFTCATILKTQAQTYVYDGQGNLIAGSHIKSKPGSTLVLKDSLTGNIFLLDSTHINIYAFNTKGDTLWKTDPWKDNKLEVYRVKRPVIVDFDFATNKWTDNKEVIWIVYNNTQFGTINKEVGKFRWMGQD